MTTPIPATSFADPAPAHRLERAAAALTAHGFTVEVLDDAAAERTRMKDLIPEGDVVVGSVAVDAAASIRGDGEVWLDAEVHINRGDFGPTWNPLGLTSMHNTLTIHAVFVRR
jgi:hypothetical protein